MKVKIFSIAVFFAGRFFMLMNGPSEEIFYYFTYNDAVSENDAIANDVN